jgi:hypothetical protein
MTTVEVDRVALATLVDYARETMADYGEVDEVAAAVETTEAALRAD